MHGRLVMAIAAVAAACALLATGAPLASGTYAQQSGTLSFDPASPTVAPGSVFTLRVMQNVGATTTGAQTSIAFDPTFIRVIDVQVGAAYAGTELLAAGSVDAAINGANTTGVLACLATFMLPGTGTVPPGPQEFLLITMQATDVAGSTPVIFDDMPCGTGPEGYLAALDEFGGPIFLSGIDGSVTVDAAAPPTTPPAASTAGQTTPMPAATGTPRRQGTVLSGSRRPVVGEPEILVSPATLTVEKETEFELEIRQSVPVDVKSANVEVSFDKNVIELLSVAPGDEWQGASGTSEQLLNAAVEEANAEGKLSGLSFTSRDVVPAGEAVVVTLQMRARNADGTSAVELTSLELTDATGAPIDAQPANGMVVVGAGESSGGGGLPWLLVIGGLAALVAVAGGGFYVYQRRKTWA